MKLLNVWVILKCTILGIAILSGGIDSSEVVPQPIPQPVLIPTGSSPSRVNVVKENPSLDVGPLIEVSVSEGGAARLPCVHQPQNGDDAVSLVLWYRNDTSRPFLSYDARARSLVPSLYPEVSQQTGVSYTPGGTKERIYLSDGGASLVINGVNIGDQAEYRCKVHYSHSPSVAHRLKLNVTPLDDAIRPVQIFDSRGSLLADEIGPLTEGTHLSLSCKATCITGGTSKTLDWLMNGRSIGSGRTTTEESLIVSNLELILTREHVLATLTCRLNCRQVNHNHAVKSSITDASTTILMNYVPRATILIDPWVLEGKGTDPPTQGGQGGSTFRAAEGVTVTFVCVVKALPPPYNISWLHNGRIIGSGNRRWVKRNSSVVVSPVSREDSGLYTCLASNTEGDGQSNALNFRVSHAPYCKGDQRREVIATKDTPVMITCEVEAEPSNVTFTWNFGFSKSPPLPLRTAAEASSNMQIYSPHSESRKGAFKNPLQPNFRSDPHNSRRSILTLPAESNVTNLSCFARNHIGRMQVPCLFFLTFVDKLQPLDECNPTVLSSTQIRVTCAPLAPPEQRISNLRDGSIPQTPGLSFVLSPQAKVTSHLEVWESNSLLYNLSSEEPIWVVEPLPPNTNLLLRLYTSSAHSHSEPVLLMTRTGTRPTASVTAGSTGTPGPAKTKTEKPKEKQVKGKGDLGVFSLIFSLVGGIGLMLALLLLSIYLLKRRGRRRTPLLLGLTTPSVEANLFKTETGPAVLQRVTDT